MMLFEKQKKIEEIEELVSGTSSAKTIGQVSPPKDPRRSVISNPSSPLENEKIQSEIEKRENKDRIDIPVPVTKQSTTPVQDVFGCGLNTIKNQQAIIEFK